MDWKALMDDFRAQADTLTKQAEAKYAELKKSADADGNGVPDALEAAMNQTRKAADAAKARYAELKASFDKDGDGVPDKLEGLGAETKQAFEQARTKMAEFAKSAQERMAGAKPGGPTTPTA